MTKEEELSILLFIEKASLLLKKSKTLFEIIIKGDKTTIKIEKSVENEKEE